MRSYDKLKCPQPANRIKCTVAEKLFAAAIQKVYCQQGIERQVEERRDEISKTLGEALEEIPEELKPYFNDYKANIFEIAWLTDEQVEMFQSDFRIVADYFVQMRKNKNYVPSDRQITHVKEVLRLMSVLTKDNRFEEACNEVEKGEEVSTMNEWLDKVENRGMRRGQISEYIKIRREDGYPEDEIESAIIKRYGLTEEQAEDYMRDLATV